MTVGGLLLAIFALLIALDVAAGARRPIPAPGFWAGVWTALLLSAIGLLLIFADGAS